MELTTGHTVNKDTIQWDSLSDWSHYDASYNGVNYNGTYMTTFVLKIFGTLKMFRFFTRRLTSSNPANGLVNDNSIQVQEILDI